MEHTCSIVDVIIEIREEVNISRLSRGSHNRCSDRSPFNFSR
jgi:hypothetical protein